MASEDKGTLYCYTNSDGSVEAILSFYREQMLYDVENYSYIEGHVMQTDNVHQKHTVQDVGEEGNVDRVTRVFNLAIAECKEMLYPYTKSEVSDPELNDKLKEQSAYGIVLSVPSTFSQTTLVLLLRLVHEYVVCTAVADWMSITNPEKEETWLRKVEELKRKILASKHARRSAEARRRRLHPF